MVSVFSTSTGLTSSSDVPNIPFRPLNKRLKKPGCSDAAADAVTCGATLGLALTLAGAASGGTSVGNIYAGTGTVTAGVPATVVNQTGILSNESESVFYTVPAGYTAFIYRWSMSSGNTTADEWTRFTLRVRPFGGVFGIKAQYHLPGSGVYECSAAAPMPLPEKTDLDILAAASDGTASVSTQLQIVLVKNQVA